MNLRDNLTDNELAVAEAQGWNDDTLVRLLFHQACPPNGPGRLAFFNQVAAEENATADSIYRTVFTVEVFSRGPLDLTVDSDPDASDLAAIDEFITTGGGIGYVQQTSQLVVPPAELPAHLERIGNDGSFFEDGNGHCDTCGAMCDGDGCMADRTHVAAIDPTAPAAHPYGGQKHRDEN